MISRLEDYRVKVYGRSNTKVLFLFCPFGIRRWQLRVPFLPIERLIKNGYQVVCYDFNTQKVTSDPQHSVAIFDQVFSDFSTRMQQYKDQGISEFSCFGTSMGTLFASYCAANNPDISHVVLNLAYGDFTDHILALPKMQFLPKDRISNFIHNAGGEKQLRTLVQKYSPLNNAQKLGSKKVLLYLSTQDSVMPHALSLKLKEALEKSGTNLTYVENTKHDHYQSAFRNHLKSSVFLDFLAK